MQAGLVKLVALACTMSVAAAGIIPSLSEVNLGSLSPEIHADILSHKAEPLETQPLRPPVGASAKGQDRVPLHTGNHISSHLPVAINLPMRVEKPVFPLEAAQKLKANREAMMKSNTPSEKVTIYHMPEKMGMGESEQMIIRDPQTRQHRPVTSEEIAHIKANPEEYHHVQIPSPETRTSTSKDPEGKGKGTGKGKGKV